MGETRRSFYDRKKEWGKHLAVNRESHEARTTFDRKTDQLVAKTPYDGGEDKPWSGG